MASSSSSSTAVSSAGGGSNSSSSGAGSSSSKAVEQVGGELIDAGESCSAVQYVVSSETAFCVARPAVPGINDTPAMQLLHQVSRVEACMQVKQWLHNDGAHSGLSRLSARHACPAKQPQHVLLIHVVQTVYWCMRACCCLRLLLPHRQGQQTTICCLMHAAAAVTGLPQQLPSFLWQAAAVVANGTPQPHTLPAVTQQLRSLPLSQAASLVRSVVYILAHPRCISAHPMNWQWAEQVLQQLLKCAVAAALLRVLPGGCLDAAGIAVDHTVGSSSGSGSGTGSRPVGDSERSISVNVTASAACLFEAAQRQRNATTGGGEEEMQQYFASQPVVAEVALQLLAVRCLLMQQQLAQWQQQQQQRELMSRQQGRHMRHDVLLLLLASNLQQHLAQLLPPEVMIDVLAAYSTAGQPLTDMPAGKQHWEEISSLVSVLHLHVQSIAKSSNHGSISSPALSAAALQLSAVLLLLAGAEWQRHWCALTVQQQELLNTGPAALDEAAATEANRVRQQLAPAGVLLTQSTQLLRQQNQVLWDGGQWQPHMQLLQQGGGEVLLQGLKLAVHCVDKDAAPQPNKLQRLFSLLEVLQPRLGA
jgi:hypothetical protein